MEEGQKPLEIKITSAENTKPGDFLVLDRYTAVPIITTDGEGVVARKSYTDYICKYESAIILHQDGTWSIGKNIRGKR